jgi:hypothetical protein
VATWLKANGSTLDGSNKGKGSIAIEGSGGGTTADGNVKALVGDG